MFDTAYIATAFWTLLACIGLVFAFAAAFLSDEALKRRERRNGPAAREARSAQEGRAGHAGGDGHAGRGAHAGGPARRG